MILELFLPYSIDTFIAPHNIFDTEDKQAITNTPSPSSERNTEEGLTYEERIKLHKYKAEINRQNRNEEWARQDEQKKEDQDREDAREEDRRAREDARDREERCEKVRDEYQEEISDRDEKIEDWETKFYEEQDKIKELENKIAEHGMKAKSDIEELKQSSNKNIQDGKDNMGREFERLDGKIQKLEAGIDELTQALEKVEDQRLNAFYARRKQQNDFYSKCFGEAVAKTEQKRQAHFKKIAQGRLSRRSFGDLMFGGKKRTRGQFDRQFDVYLNLCLNNQAALRQKKNMKDQYELMERQLAIQEQRVQKRIDDLKKEIKELDTSGRVDILNRFKEKMQNQLNTFNETYDSHAHTQKVQTNIVIQQIQAKKQKQAYYLKNRLDDVNKPIDGTLMTKCENRAKNLFESEEPLFGGGKDITEILRSSGGGAQ